MSLVLVLIILTLIVTSIPRVFINVLNLYWQLLPRRSELISFAAESAFEKGLENKAVPLIYLTMPVNSSVNFYFYVMTSSQMRVALRSRLRL